MNNPKPETSQTLAQSSKVELKSLKYSATQSQGTHCFQATVYIDGKKAGWASNTGKGHAHDYSDRQLHQRLDEIAKGLPPYYEPELRESFALNGEYLLSLLITEELERRDIARFSKRQVRYRIPGKEYEPNTWHVRQEPLSEKSVAALIAQFGDQVLIAGHNCHRLA